MREEFIASVFIALVFIAQEQKERTVHKERALQGEDTVYTPSTLLFKM